MYILFNFIKIYFTKINLRECINDLELDALEIKSINTNLDFNELLEVFSSIRNNRPSLLVSMLFLRRLLPNILNIITEALDIPTNIYFYENETLFDNGIKISNIELKEDEGIKIVEQYLFSLKQVLWEFSLNGKQFSTYFKDMKEKGQDNFTRNRNYLFYNFGLDKIKRTRADKNESFRILNYAYKKMFYKIKIDYNWNFHFFELLFHCFYLTFIDCSNNLYYKKNQNQDYFSLLKYVNDFLDYYENYDYYLNFINEEGANMNISKLISRNYFDNFNYKKFNQKYNLRNKLIKEQKYDYMTRKGPKIINISKVDPKCFFIIDNSYYDNEIKIMLNNRKNNNNNLFSNNYDSINSSLKRFIFEGYDEKKNSSIEEYYNDLLRFFP